MLFVRWWMARVPDVLSYRRVHETHLFFDEMATVTLEVRNRSAIPIPWLQYSERLPLRLGYTTPHVGAAYIPGQGVRKLHYTLRGSRRGLYALGPLTLSYGDIFGFEDRIIRGVGTDRLSSTRRSCRWNNCCCRRERRLAPCAPATRCPRTRRA